MVTLSHYQTEYALILFNYSIQRGGNFRCIMLKHITKPIPLSSHKSKNDTTISSFFGGKHIGFDHDYLLVHGNIEIHYFHEPPRSSPTLLPCLQHVWVSRDYTSKPTHSRNWIRTTLPSNTVQDRLGRPFSQPRCHFVSPSLKFKTKRFMWFRFTTFFLLPRYKRLRDDFWNRFMLFCFPEFLVFEPKFCNSHLLPS